MKNQSCRACYNEMHGVKTRLAVPHTCGLEEISVTISKGRRKGWNLYKEESETSKTDKPC